MEKKTFMPHELKDLLMKEAKTMQNTKSDERKRIADVSSIPDFDMILGQGVYFSRDDYKTQLNNNVCVVGTSGAGKTRSIVKPNLLQARGSYVVSDPKGNLAKELGPYLEKKGYEVVKMNFIHPEKSIGYNPLDYCRTTQDIQQLAHMLVYELGFNKDSGKGSIDPFWDETAQILLMSLISYIKETDAIPEEQKTISLISELVRECKNDDKSAGYNDSTRKKNRLDERMEAHRKKSEKAGVNSWAVNRFDDFCTAPPKTYNTIIICALAKLSSFDTVEVRKMLAGKCFDFRKVGQKPMAVFVEVSDTDRSMDVLVNLFYSQLMNELCRFADDECTGSRLPVPVQFILDDFATNARIGNFQNIIANIRSRGISTMIMLQSEAQLRSYYGDDSQTIVDNCNTYVYMGGSNPEQAKIVGRRANKIDTTILDMPVGTSWVFRRGQKPILCSNFDLEAFCKVKGLVKDEQGPSEPEVEGYSA
ncbi:MAG: type IV secretory system conjugative DNA transfer family protein [Lachnospiraceae bacterium]|nr:type IV secretory system conjugative DNA transfer family protein [Lachnospiraceae bacterium]